MDIASAASKAEPAEVGLGEAGRPVWLSRVSAGGLALGAAGLLVQAGTGADLPRPVPPGAAILLVAAVLTMVVRRSGIPFGSALIAVLVLRNVLPEERLDVLVGRHGVGVAVGAWMLLLGAVTTLTAAVLMLRISYRARADRAPASSPSSSSPRSAREAMWARRCQVAALLVLAPVCAEYLAAYDDSTGDPVRLVGGLLIFIPLYGAPALLIREVCRRADVGWVGIVLLSAAFGLTQAGLVDQSLFSLDYRDIESWDDTLKGTFVEPLGLSAYNVLNFVGGHVIYSICAPIALVEAFRPGQRREPWLGLRALTVVALLYVAASALVLVDHLKTESSHASGAQLAGSIAVVGILVLLVLLIRARRRLLVDARRSPLVHARRRPLIRARSERPVPRPRNAFIAALFVAIVYNLVPPTWVGFGVGAATLAVAGGLVHRAARSCAWTVQHVVAVAAAAVLTRAVLAFTYFPVIGEVSAIRKYGHNLVLLLAVLAVSVLAARAAAGRNLVRQS